MVRSLTIYIYALTRTLAVDPADPAAAARVWDEIHAVATLQGIVNRSAPRLYLRYVEYNGRNIDDWWLARLTEPGAWLHGAQVRPVESLEDLVTLFRADLAGAVVYDPRVPATSNLASTIAGLENLVAVRYDETPGSVYHRLILSGPRLPVKVRLIADDGAALFPPRGDRVAESGPALQDSAGRPAAEDLTALLAAAETGSAKCAAYLWAQRQFIDTGRCDPRYLAYYIDSCWINHAAAGPPNQHTLTNHDYFVAKRAFFCDLHCWGEETPVDDPQQPRGADRATLIAILRALHARNGGAIVHVGGFTPWAYKYTDQPGAGGRHGGVDTEWELVRLLSAHNAALDADALGLGAMANASFFMHYPLAKRYPQGAESAATRPAGDPHGGDAERQRSAGEAAAASRPNGPQPDYLMFYVGDFDSAAWLYQRVLDLWEDPLRGQVPLSWAISPLLERRAPMAMAHLWGTRSPLDAFVAADNGAGYLNPALLVAPRPVSGLPDGLEAWTEHCQTFYGRWDLRISGFVIDGHGPAMPPAALEAFARFSPDGLVAQKVAAAPFLQGSMPVLQAGPDINADDPRVAAEAIAGHVRQRRAAGLHFHWFRAILRSPSWYAAVVKELRAADPQIEPVTAPVFFEQLRADLTAHP